MRFHSRNLFLGFNRTFMELKYTTIIKHQGVLKVLIVPLWN